MALNLTPKAPPARKAKPSGAKPLPPKNSPALTEKRAEGIHGLFGLGATGLMMMRQPHDAAAVIEHGENISGEVAKLAETNANIAKVADWLCAVGPYAGLLTAVMPLILQIAANHDKVPVAAVAQFGVVEPAVLMQKLETKMLTAQAEVAEANAAARAEYQAAQVRMEKVAS